ncbi:exported hypothetical protein [Streptomyces misionensis JCM 4497]
MTGSRRRAARCCPGCWASPPTRRTTRAAAPGGGSCSSRASPRARWRTSPPGRPGGSTTRADCTPSRRRWAGCGGRNGRCSSCACGRAWTTRRRPRRWASRSARCGPGCRAPAGSSPGSPTKATGNHGSAAERPPVRPRSRPCPCGRNSHDRQHRCPEPARRPRRDRPSAAGPGRPGPHARAAPTAQGTAHAAHRPRPRRVHRGRRTRPAHPAAQDRTRRVGGRAGPGRRADRGHRPDRQRGAGPRRHHDGGHGHAARRGPAAPDLRRRGTARHAHRARRPVRVHPGEDPRGRPDQRQGRRRPAGGRRDVAGAGARAAAQARTVPGRRRDPAHQRRTGRHRGHPGRLRPPHLPLARLAAHRPRTAARLPVRQDARGRATPARPGGVRADRQPARRDDAAPHGRRPLPGRRRDPGRPPDRRGSGRDRPAGPRDRARRHALRRAHRVGLRPEGLLLPRRPHLPDQGHVVREGRHPAVRHGRTGARRRRQGGPQARRRGRHADRLTPGRRRPSPRPGRGSAVRTDLRALAVTPCSSRASAR